MIIKRISATILVSVIAISTSTLQALDLDGARSKDLIPVEVRPIAVLEPRPKPQHENNQHKHNSHKVSNNKLEVTAWVDRKSNVYRLGEAVHLYVKSNKDAYITVIDLGTTGATTVIFPNRYQSSNFVRGGEVLTIPQAQDNFTLKVTGKPGRETLKIIATAKPNDLIPGDYLKDIGPYRTVARSKDITVVPKIADRIDQLLNNPNNPEEWDEYTKVLTIK